MVIDGSKTAKEIIDSLIKITETMQKSALIPEIFENHVISWCLKHNLDFDKTKIKIEENKNVCCLPTRAFDFSYVFPYYRYKMFTAFFNHPLFENSIVIDEQCGLKNSDMPALISIKDSKSEKKKQLLLEEK